jgi:hypothetical protein
MSHILCTEIAAILPFQRMRYLAQLEDYRKIRLFSHSPAESQLLEVFNRQQLAPAKLPA